MVLQNGCMADLAFECCLIHSGKVVQPGLQVVCDFVDLIYVILQAGNMPLKSSLAYYCIRTGSASTTLV